MGNTPYDNYFLQNEVEDQFKSHLNLQSFVTVDTSLAGNAGDVVKINRYKATDGTEIVGLGTGNTKSIEVGFTQKEYRVKLAQNRFTWYDDEERVDPNIVPVGVRHCGTDMFNTVNAEIYKEFNNATLSVSATSLTFDTFVDAMSLLNFENIEEVDVFAFISRNDMAKLRKGLKEDLKYIEAFAKTGYVGTVAGVHIYTKKDAVDGEIIVATKEAVKLFVKPVTEVERVDAGNRGSEDANIRKNIIFTRKLFIPAFVDEGKAVKITIS